jgi:phospholipid/cholesterol/gamma-HCH transport system substrate-binding protein
MASSSFSERNPVPIAFIGVLVLIALVVFGLTASQLPIFAGSTYHAEFSDAGGLKANDPVRIAGVNVGSVSDIELDGSTVDVTFAVKHHDLGDLTRATIKTQTLLGARFLNIEPAGKGELADSTIPIQRTQAPYSITDAVNDLTTITSGINKPQLGAALNAFSDAFQGTPSEVTPTLDGLTRLSDTISSRNDELQDLLKNANGTTAVLADRSAQFVTLVRDANQLLVALEQRRAEIRALFGKAQQVFIQVRGLIQDNEAQIGPVLDQTNAVLANLERNDGNIQTAIKNLSVFARTLGEAIGSGPLFAAQVQNLVPTSLVGTPVGDLAKNLFGDVGLPAVAPNLTSLLTPGTSGGNR